MSEPVDIGDIGQNKAKGGFNLKLFMMAVVAATVVIIACLYFFVFASGTRDIPKADKPHPNAQLILPMQPLTKAS